MGEQFDHLTAEQKAAVDCQISKVMSDPSLKGHEFAVKYPNEFREMNREGIAADPENVRVLVETMKRENAQATATRIPDGTCVSPGACPTRGGARINQRE